MEGENGQTQMKFWEATPQVSKTRNIHLTPEEDPQYKGKHIPLEHTSI